MNIQLLLNGKKLTAKPFEERSDISKDERQYNYEPGVSCGELEGSNIDVNITGFPETIEAKLRYSPHWHVHAYIGPYWGMWNHARKAECRLPEAEDPHYESAEGNTQHPSEKGQPVQARSAAEDRTLRPAFSYHAADRLVGKLFYTAVNMWQERGQIESTNYHKGSMIPLGTIVKITHIDDGTNGTPLQTQLMPEQSIEFSTIQGRSYKVILMQSQSKSGATIWDLAQRYFTENDPKVEGSSFRAFTAREQSDVLAGEIKIGMSKAAVLMAYGYPPKTPSLETDIWVYPEVRKTRTVEFSDGRVIKDSGREFILTGKEFGPASFSPDGSEIVFSLGTKESVFSDDSEQSSRIYKVRIDGTALVALTKGDGIDFDPVYSPDGGKILFSSRSGGQTHICTMKTDGSERSCLTNSPGCDYNAIFSPDGKKIYFLRAASYGNYSPIAMPNWHDIDIFSINSDGSDLRRITSNSYYGMGNLSISPDGNTLIARILAYKSDHSVWMIPVNNPADATPVEPNLEEYKSWFKSVDYNGIYNPLYSADGTSLVFTWSGNIYVMDLKTNKAQRVTDTERVIYYYPRLSRDGQSILFSTTSRVKDPGLFGARTEEPALWIINKDGTGLKYVDIGNTHVDQTVELERHNSGSYVAPPMRPLHSKH